MSFKKGCVACSKETTKNSEFRHVCDKTVKFNKKIFVLIQQDRVALKHHASDRYTAYLLSY